MEEVVSGQTGTPPPTGDSTQLAQPTVQPTPAVPAAPAPVFTPPPPPPTPSFFSGITLADVLVGAVTFCGMFLIIYYYRREIKYAQKEKSEIRQQLDEVTTNVQSALGPNYQKF